MSERRRALALLAAAVIYLILILPNQPGVLTAAGLRRFPLEFPLILLVLAACPRRLAPVLRGALVAFLAATFALKLADLAAETAFLRPFNPVLDGNLVAAAWRLASGAIGWPLASAAVLGLLAAVVATGALAWWATGRLASLAPPRRRPFAALFALPALALAFLDASGRANLPGHARTAQMSAEHISAAVRARADLAAFRANAARDPWADAAPETILPGLRGTDILLVFVESYGRAALDNPLYAATTTAALRDIEAALAARGLAARSGYLAAPMVGGQSWLAHASVLSGLSIDNEGKYRALLGSKRRTLLHLAQRAGWQTAAVMPAITLAWPEAGWFGYDRVLAARDLGYRGAPFGWVTMPDQYTLAALGRALLAPSDRPAVMAEVALVSSHAPWTPLPTPLPWNAIGDGSVFTPALAAGDPADAVWLDEDRVREQYRRAIDYSLRAIGGFAALPADPASGRPRLLVILGDHQPVTFVSSDPVGRDVPVHAIGPSEILARLDHWGWTPGMIPAADGRARPMAAFRDLFLAAFGMEAAPAASLPDEPGAAVAAPLAPREAARQ